MTDRQSKLRRKLRSYRSAKTGSIFLAAVSLFVLVLVVSTGQTGDDAMCPAYASTCFWPAMAYICHLKAKLIRIELADSEDDAH